MVYLFKIALNPLIAHVKAGTILALSLLIAAYSITSVPAYATQSISKESALNAPFKVAQIVYIERPPFYYTKTSSESDGIIIQLLNQIAEQQNITLAYQTAPDWASVVHHLKGKVNSCFAGSYKVKERKKWFQFTDAIYLEKPYVIATHKKLANYFKRPPTVTELLSSDFIMGHQQGFSYGDKIDRSLTRYKTPVAGLSYLTHSFGDNIQRHVFKLISRQRIDYYLINPVELSWILKKNPKLKYQISVLKFANPPDPNARHLMCSKDVDKRFISFMNASIKQLKKSSAYSTVLDNFNHSY
ncbi:substrate-binding periplasmic protein [Flocculibacter collagenilyticus]|uniref:substrate-binding periplasmic protein n=1 Tax=Flocculibacter collagenilyticus TaxID=2744479 RepID=UPI0018F3DA32|nr:transporter substrate-binding domain-containing protein [Flocculibacter collagenilyticus]